MSEKRNCEGCGQDYWWPAARWQHEGCATNAATNNERLTDVSNADVSNVVVSNAQRVKRWREAHLEESRRRQREYMRRVRAKAVR